MTLNLVVNQLLQYLLFHLQKYVVVNIQVLVCLVLGLNTVFDWTVSQNGVTGVLQEQELKLKIISATGYSTGNITYAVPSIGGCFGAPVDILLTVNVNNIICQ